MTQSLVTAWVVAASLLLLPGAAAGQGADSLSPPGITVIAGGVLIDGTGAPPRPADVVIAEGRITAVEKPGSPVPEGAQVINARNRWVLPGLIDSHVHYGPWMGELFLLHGVTSVFDLGGEVDTALMQREAVRSGEVRGPRLFVVGQALRGLPPSATPDPTRESRLSSAAAARARAQQLLDRGVDGIKISTGMPAEWIRAVVEIAHARNKPVVAHLSTPAGEAIDAGLDGLIHPYTVDLSTLSDPRKLAYITENMQTYVDRLDYYPYHLLEPARYGPFVEKMASRGAFFNPTFGAQFRGIYPERDEFDAYDSTFLDLQTHALGYLIGPVRQQLWPFFGRLRFHEIGATQRKDIEAGMANVVELMRQFVKAGGRMVAGTDTATIGIPGIRLHRELQLWVSRGIPAMEAIRAATSYPAALFRLGDLGTVEVGKRADVLILRGNPLEDMRLIGAIDTVLQEGRVVRRELSPATFLPLVQPQR